MTKHLHTLTFAVMFALASGTVTRAQESSATKTESVQPITRLPLIPVRVQIVISRYQGDKKISSLPYTLSVNANDGSRRSTGQYVPDNKTIFRMGTQVPVLPVDDKGMPTGRAVYRDVGTNIDCFASTRDDGRFNVSISFEDSSVYPNSQGANGTPKLNETPAFRQFSIAGAVVVLKDGQTAELATATDKFSGEVVKVDVTLTVVK